MCLECLLLCKTVFFVSKNKIASFTITTLIKHCTFYQAIIGYIRRGFLHAIGNTLVVSGKQTVITKATTDLTHTLTALMSEL